MSEAVGTATLIVLCGRSFSGKSTLGIALAASWGAEVVSLDAINERRGLPSGHVIPVEEWQRTHEVARGEVVALLASRRSVVLDDTSSLRFLREGWRALAREAGAVFALVFVDTARDEIERRVRANRADPVRHDVEDGVLAEHLDGFEAPGADERPVVVGGGVVVDAEDVVARIRSQLDG
ncbi:AAA family ATPase [Herbiconiux sp. VKM Ac-1786]|uniref:AAA family ATPase n=1 Tax=Herbiconiux sp. VKM Ac-1786 TaxID=2783824 RepID=UPI00351C97EB